MPAVPRIEIEQIGPVARACLASGQQGKVIAVFSKAAYLLTDTNQLFWIVTGNAPMHQRCVRAQAPLSAIHVGMPFYMEQQHLRIGTAYGLDSTASSLWTIPAFNRAGMLEITALFPRIVAFFSKLDVSQAKGFGNFIPVILSLAQNLPAHQPSDSTDSVLFYAQSRVLRLAHACLQHDKIGVSEHAETLIGLGSGLTPSGDDFVGGLLFALAILQSFYGHAEQYDYNVQIESYSSKTNLISYTLLSDLAHGHAIAPLHQIVNRLLSGATHESIYPFVGQLTGVGNSTGWDLLAGLLTGFLSTH